MRDDEIRRLLTDANPWWRTAATTDELAWMSQHRLLRDRASYDLGYRTPVLSDLAQQPVMDTLVLLTGPRRIGKSVALIDLAAQLCQRPDVDPRCVIHLPCDGMKPRDLRRALTLARVLTRSVDNPDQQRRAWLIDEVGEVDDWTSTIKSARDQSAFGEDTVVLTSSHLTGGTGVAGNLLAGRAGSSGLRRLRELLPMTFRDYLVATRPQLPRPERVHPGELQHPQVERSVGDLQIYVDDYDLAWQDYLTCGGFPRAVAEHTRTGAVSEAYLRDIQAWLHTDVDPSSAQQSTLRLLEELSARCSSPLSVSNLADTLGLSRPAMTLRLNRLVNSFAGLWCPQRSDEGRTIPGSQAKLYLTDPMLAWIPPRLRAGAAEPDMTKLTEMSLGVALARAMDDIEEGRWIEGDTIGYARTGSGNEVDLAPVPIATAAGPALTTPIESKWVDQGWRAEARTLEGKYQRGLVATKSILDLGHPSSAIPAPLVALLLG